MATNFFNFYDSILQNELCYVYGDENEEMETSMDNLLESYSVQGLKTADSLDFDERELRCAYLYLYSTSHSHMVLEALNRLYEENFAVFLDLICAASKSHRSFNITSLGGGPGSDPLGILTFLERIGLLSSCPSVRVNLVDEYYGWESIFLQVMDKFRKYSIQPHFTTQDLLLSFSPEVQGILKNTHFLSMVKFVSAISGDKYGAMISFQRIFSLLQPGTMVLIIDNAGGQDFNHALNTAKNMGLMPVLEPKLHHKFQVPKTLEPGMGRMPYEKRPQTSSTISIAILRKPGIIFNNTYIAPANYLEKPCFNQEQRDRSRGPHIESRTFENSGLDQLPPILKHLQLAQQLNSRSRTSPKTNTPSTASSYIASQTYVNNNLQKPTSSSSSRLSNQPDMQSNADASSSPPTVYGTSRSPYESAQPKPSITTYNRPTGNTSSTTSLAGTPRGYESVHPKPSSTIYNQPTANTSSTTSLFETNSFCNKGAQQKRSNATSNWSTPNTSWATHLFGTNTVNYDGAQQKPSSTTSNKPTPNTSSTSSVLGTNTERRVHYESAQPKPSSTTSNRPLGTNIERRFQYESGQPKPSSTTSNRPSPNTSCTTSLYGTDRVYDERTQPKPNGQRLPNYNNYHYVRVPTQEGPIRKKGCWNCCIL